MDASPLTPPAPRPPVNLRSIALGLIGVTFICAITPYNTYVLNNVDLVSNPLSVGLVLFFSVFVILITPPFADGCRGGRFLMGSLAVCAVHDAREQRAGRRSDSCARCGASGGILGSRGDQS